MASWLVEEVGDVETELAGTARGRGGDGGRGITVARLRLRSGSRGRAEEGEGVDREQRARGETEGATGHIQTRRGRLGGKHEVELGRARCRHASAYWQRWKKTKAPLVGWADSAGPPGEWASGKRQVSPSLSLSLFYLF